MGRTSYKLGPEGITCSQIAAKFSSYLERKKKMVDG